MDSTLAVLRNFLCRNYCRSVTSKFKLQGPATQDAPAGGLWRRESPKLRSLQRLASEIPARSTRFEFRAFLVTRLVYIDFDADLHRTSNRFSRPLEDIGQDSLSDLAADHRAGRKFRNCVCWLFTQRLGVNGGSHGSWVFRFLLFFNDICLRSLGWALRRRLLHLHRCGWYGRLFERCGRNLRRLRIAVQ